MGTHTIIVHVNGTDYEVVLNEDDRVRIYANHSLIGKGYWGRVTLRIEDLDTDLGEEVLDELEEALDELCSDLEYEKKIW